MTANVTKGSLRGLRAEQKKAAELRDNKRLQIYPTGSLARPLPSSATVSTNPTSNNTNNNTLPDTTSSLVYTVSKHGFLLNQAEQKEYMIHMNTNEYKDNIRKQNHRSYKWLHMLNNWPTFTSTKRNKLKSRIRKGIPAALRAKAWTRILNVKELSIEDSEYYSTMSTTIPNAKTKRSINNDIDRTFPKHVLFNKSASARGKDSLQKVLYAYANHDVHVGYTQGMGFIVALLLMVMTEEYAFYCLLKILDTKGIHGMRGLYLDGLPTLHLRYFQFASLFQQFLPRLSQHVLSFEIVPELYASKWFITIFCYEFSFDFVYRIWDIYLFEGTKFTFRVALALLKKCEAHILKITQFDEMMKYMQHLHLQIESIDELLKTAFDFALKHEDLHRIEDIYNKKTLRNKRNMRRSRSAGNQELTPPDIQLIDRTLLSSNLSKSESNSDSTSIPSIITFVPCKTNVKSNGTVVVEDEDESPIVGQPIMYNMQSEPVWKNEVENKQNVECKVDETSHSDSSYLKEDESVSSVIGNNTISYRKNMDIVPPTIIDDANIDDVNIDEEEEN